MNKLFLVAIVAGIFTSSASAGMSYECWMYKGGSPWKMLHVVADNKSEAESKALAKFQYHNWNGDYVKCH
jgi:hypothetical protein